LRRGLGAGLRISKERDMKGKRKGKLKTRNWGKC
jgi:hypothetical protein